METDYTFLIIGLLVIAYVGFLLLSLNSRIGDLERQVEELNIKCIKNKKKPQPRKKKRMNTKEEREAEGLPGQDAYETGLIDGKKY